MVGAPALRLRKEAIVVIYEIALPRLKGKKELWLTGSARIALYNSKGDLRDAQTGVQHDWDLTQVSQFKRGEAPHRQFDIPRPLQQRE